ncbi:hypothetical protein [Mucilaginibacter gilvus]|uniref:hypothetical protein n=1 Tax=Mucilaginibacter gilvus TaxID=2305909 RepID=UPI001FBA4EA4|nr:hypothetical protein [Mucilaginibacter gilvus]
MVYFVPALLAAKGKLKNVEDIKPFPIILYIKTSIIAADWLVTTIGDYTKFALAVLNLSSTPDLMMG